MIGAVLLAAGESTRMGAVKPLLPFGEVTLIEHVTRQLVDSDVSEIVIVLGHEAEKVRRALVDLPVRIVVNPRYPVGMLSSIRCGLDVLSPSMEAALIGPVDQPGLTSDIVDALIRAWRASGKSIAVPVHNGRRGHPLIFAARHFGEVFTDFDAVGLRGLLQRHPDDILEVSFDDPAVLGDTDTPEDYRREMQRIKDEGPV